ncbi:MAG: 16S rRNA (uracil(1498)-N(3))-methyltransferase [Thermodesulfobacteriota bacterium]
MKRFYVSQLQIEKGVTKVEGSEARHIRKILRLKPGDEVILFNGSTQQYLGTIIEDHSNSVTIRIQKILPSQSESPLEVTLAQSLLKGEKMDYLIQKATELGVRRVIPFLSSRSIPRLDESQLFRRQQRWEKIAIEASKQCGRGIIPSVDPLQDYSNLLKNAPNEALRLLLWEKEGVRLKDFLRGLTEKKEVFFVVGPEGGLSKEEVIQAEQFGFIPVFLGERILRAETVSLCILSILQYEWGDL